MIEENNQLKDRINKAIEYVENIIECKYDYEQLMYYEEIHKLLKILKGEDSFKEIIKDIKQVEVDKC